MDDHDSSRLFGLRGEGVGLRVAKAPETAESGFLLQSSEQLHDRPLYIGTPFSPWRFLTAMLIAVCGMAVLLSRAGWMQIWNGDVYTRLAEKNRLRVELIPPKRGVIRDRNGVPLAQNIPSFDLHLIPRFVPPGHEGDELLGTVGRIVDVSISDLRAFMASSTDPDEHISVKRDLSYERAIALHVLLGNIPAFQIVTGTKRSYPIVRELKSLSHILGYVGQISPDELTLRTSPNALRYRQTDTIGKTGVEFAAEAPLRGLPGMRTYEVDARHLITNAVAEEPAQDGADVRLSIDLELQRATERALQSQLDKSNLHAGAAIAIDPQNGAILAIVSLPSYDANIFSGTVSSTGYADLLRDENHPLYPRAWAGTYPSGSTVKPVIATAALAEHVIAADTTVRSTGGLSIGSSFFPDWKAGGHGITNVRKAIAWSVNTFFYTVGGGYESFIGLGVDRLSEWLKRFGLGSATGFDLPGEQNGFVPTKAWKEEEKKDRWYIGDTYNLSIGQGDLLVTPLQVALFTAEIANGGYRIEPHVLNEQRTSNIAQHAGNGEAETGNRERILDDPFAVRTVQLGMRDTVIYGSGRALKTFPVPVAGKTGTAQWRKDKPNHAWFTSYAPFDKPEIVVTVLIEEGVEGSSVAIPVAREILDAWLTSKQRGAHTTP